MGITRAQVAPGLKWHLEDIYPSNALWEKEFTETKKEVDAFPVFAGTLHQGGDALLAALRQKSHLDELTTRLYVYAHMRRDEDNANAQYQGMTDRARTLMVTFRAETAFVVPEILAIPRDTLLALAHEPRFASFRFYLEDLDRQRAHRLSAGEERIIALAEDPLSGAENIFTMLSDVNMNFGLVKDSDGTEVPLTHGSYGTLLYSHDRRVRKDAFTGMCGTYRRFSDTVAAAFATSIKGDLFYAKARGFSGAVEAALDENNVPLSVYEQLILAVRESIPAMEKYLLLKKKQLCVEQLEMYDLYTPIVPDCSLPVSYDEAKTLVYDALRPLGTRYQSLLQQAYDAGWIDVIETPGKTSGAFSWGAYGSHPYVLLNYTDTIDDAFTLCHELGHAMHSYFSNEAQPYETANYRTMVAEVASIVNESLLMQYLLRKETDKTKKAYLLNTYLEQFRTTCFRQTMFAEFELKAHRMAENGEPLTVESLCALYRKLNEEYYPGVHVDDDIAVEWMRIPHFYGAFYVYQYATGMCAAVALARSILEEGTLARYLAFLSSGDSDYPIHLLQNAGVDLTQKESILSALKVFADSVDELTELLR